MTINLGSIKVAAPNTQAVTAQPAGSGWLGNVWDIVKKTTGEMIETGSNILIQRAQEKINPPVSSPSSYPSFARSEQSPEIMYNPNQSPFSKYATDLFLSESPISRLLNNARETANNAPQAVTQKSPVWIWVGLGILGLVILMQGVRR